jgi:hypothetical protein
VLKKLDLLAPGLFQGIGQHHKPCRVQVAFGEATVVVGGCGYPLNDALLPGKDGGADGRERTERVAKDAAKGVARGNLLGPHRIVTVCRQENPECDVAGEPGIIPAL